MVTSHLWTPDESPVLAYARLWLMTKLEKWTASTNQPLQSGTFDRPEW